MTLSNEEIIPFIVNQYLKYKEDFLIQNDLSLEDARLIFKSTTSINDIVFAKFKKAREEKLLEVQKLQTKLSKNNREFENIHLETLYYYFKHLAFNTDIHIYHGFVNFWSFGNMSEKDTSWQKETPEFLIKLNRGLSRDGFIFEYKNDLRRDIYKQSEYRKLSEYFRKDKECHPEEVKLRNSMEKFLPFLKKVELANKLFDDYEVSVDEEEKLTLQAEVLSSMSSEREFLIYLIKKIERGVNISEQIGNFLMNLE